MSQHAPRTSGTRPVGARLDRAVAWLLILLLAFAPLAFGAVEPWSEAVVVAVAGAIAVLLAAKVAFYAGSRFTWSVAYVPAALFVLLAAAQLVPLPAGWVEAVAPQTAATRAELLADVRGADAALRTMPLTFYPLATRHALRLALVAVTVFVATVNVCRYPQRVRRLLAAVSIVGGAVALVALAQIVSGTDRIYWLLPTARGAARSGPFVNHGHYGQFMNLSMGAALGLLLVTVRRDRPAGGGGGAGWVPWALGCVIALGAATVLLSLTRGGAVAMGVAALFTLGVMAARRAIGRHGWGVALGAAAAFACVLFVGFDAVYERAATLGRATGYVDRWHILADLPAVFARFPVFGTGLGTFEYVYPMFDTSSSAAVASHAENEYAQTMAETGAIGLVLVLAFLAIVWVHYARSIRRLSWPIHWAAFGLGAGLLAAMVQSAVDFGQHVPANAILAAVTCGLLVRLGRPAPARRPVARPAARPARRRVARAAAAAGVVAVWAWAVLGANGARSAESHWARALEAEASVRRQLWRASNGQYADLIARAAAAVEAEPGNVVYRYWLNAYRWHAVRRVEDPETGAWLSTPRTRAFAERIAADLHAARLLCPTFGPAPCVAGQIELFALHRAEGAAHIRLGRRLAPCDPTVCFVAAQLSLREGDDAAAVAGFRRALRLDARFLGDAARVLIGEADRADLLVESAGESPYALLRVAAELGRRPGCEALAGRAKAEAVEMLERRAVAGEATSLEFACLADACYERGDYKAAVDYYGRALAGAYREVGWRYRLAESLARSGRRREAVAEARICLRMEPEMPAARALLLELAARPAGGPASGKRN